MSRVQMRFRTVLELIRDLNNTDNNLMRVTIFVYQAELHHWIIPVKVAFDIHYLIILEVFCDLFLQDVQRINKINFQ